MMPSMRRDAASRRSCRRACAALRELRGQLVHQADEAAHLLHLRDLRLEVARGRSPCRVLTLSASFCASSTSTLLLRLLDQRQDVAHAEDARRHALGVERLEAVELLATTPANLIGLPVTWRTDSAAPPRASPSSLVSTTPVSGSASLNALRGVDRVLALHRVDDEQRLDRLQRRVQLGDLVHHRLVDGEAAGGVDDQHVVVVALRAQSSARARDVDRLLADGSTGRNRRRPAAASVFSCSIAAGR